ncbi:MAG: type II toxin-antitoxin system HicB family antitoxin [Thermoplasmataceae archaeon]
MTRGFSALVSSLPGWVSQGDAREEAIENIREAIPLHVECLKEKGWQVPMKEELVEVCA